MVSPSVRESRPQVDTIQFPRVTVYLRPEDLEPTDELKVAIQEVKNTKNVRTQKVTGVGQSLQANKCLDQRSSQTTRKLWTHFLSLDYTRRVPSDNENT